MPCLKQPPQPNCQGPDGAALQMCASCRNRKNIGGRRNSVVGLAVGGASGRDIQAGWNTRMSVIVSDLFQEAYRAAQDQHPNNGAGAWSFCISGSGAREEACPFSDLDCFILVAYPTPAVLEVMRAAARNMRQMLTDMGEDGNIDTLGLRFCGGGLHPLGLGVASAPELINAPGPLASLIEQDGINGHICQGLSESRCVCGSEDLHREYRGEVEAVRGKSLSAPWSRPMLPAKKKLGLEMIGKAANQRAMRDETEVDIKTDVYRIPQVMLAGLAAYYGIEDQNSFRIVTALRARDKITRRCEQAFNNVLDVVAQFRTMAHLEQGREADTLAPTEKRNATKLPDTEWKQLMACKADLYLMQQLGLEFVKNKKNALKGNRTNPFAIG